MRRFADDPPVEERVGDALAEREATLAVAESVTGGLLAGLLTSVPGASEYFDRGWVVYSYDSWREHVGVSRETLDAKGAVSAPAAAELAARARDRADATWGLSATGIAGPKGGNEETPIGTGFVGVAYAAPWESGDSFRHVHHHTFDGDRAGVRERIARGALDDLLEHVEATDTV